MKEYNVESVRNIGLIGHGGSGKTSLAEAILYNCKETDRIGKIEDGTTICDYDPEEKKRKVTISISIAPCEWNRHRVYIVDTPGYLDFVGEVIQGLKAVDTTLITVCGVSGIQVGTEKAWSYALKSKLPRAFFINKLDRENADFQRVCSDLRDKFGTAVVPIHVPIGKEHDLRGVADIISQKSRIYDSKKKVIAEEEIAEEIRPLVDEYRNMLMEEVAETDEELLEKYLSDGELSEEEIVRGLRKGISEGNIFPVFCGSAFSNIGVESLLDSIVKYMPSPQERGEQKGINPKTGQEDTRKSALDESFSAFVFKTIADPFVGKLSIFRVMSGSVSVDSLVYNANKDKQEKLGSLYLLKGKSEIPVNKLRVGDIGAVAKLQYTLTGDTICDVLKPILYNGFEFPTPCISLAVNPKAKGDEDKISNGLTKLMEEDPTFKIARDMENAELIVSGLGELHIEILANKLKNKFGTEVLLSIPTIPYRETIKKVADVQGKYKKQSGGHGQYGDVWVKFEPQTETEDLVFVDKVVGGAVPRQYIPAVEKGLKESTKRGILAGYPVINLKATLHDGSYHPVDSSEMAFKTAASLAYKKGLKDAHPILLEPIMHIEIVVPDEYMGDVMGDINRRRGKVHGMEQQDNMQVVTAEVPMAEIFKYSTDLRAMTHARGSFTSRFERYEEVPEAVTQKIIENSTRLKEHEEE